MRARQDAAILEIADRVSRSLFADHVIALDAGARVEAGTRDCALWAASTPRCWAVAMQRAPPVWRRGLVGSTVNDRSPTERS